MKLIAIELKTFEYFLAAHLDAAVTLRLKEPTRQSFQHEIVSCVFGEKWIVAGVEDPVLIIVKTRVALSSLLPLTQLC